MKRVEPKVYLIQEPKILLDGLTEYLEETGNLEFLELMEEARVAGVSDILSLISFSAKLCYRSLSLGKNANVTRTRSIADNIVRTIEEGHGSVFEHAQITFILRDVSRVLTHELVRHRVGVCYSQESGRYCRIPKEGPGMYLPSCIVENPEATSIFEHIVDTCTDGIQKLYQLFNIDDGNFALKKILTSAIRRISPTGMANDIVFSVNLRALRHIIKMRTNRAAEEEIRKVFGQIADIVEERYPLLLHGGVKEIVNNLPEWTFPTQPHL